MNRNSLCGILLAAALASAAFHAAAGEPRAEASPAPCPGSDVVTASWEEARLSGVEFRAVGLAPRWTLELGHDRCLHFIDHDAATLVSASMPEPLREVRGGGVLYGAHDAAHQVHVGIERRTCPGATDAEAMTHTVVIRVDGREYTGCGRALSARR